MTLFQLQNDVDNKLSISFQQNVSKFKKSTIFVPVLFLLIIIGFK